MRLRVVDLPADAYLLVIDGATSAFMDQNSPDFFKQVGDTATERSDGACHGVLFFSEEIEIG